MKFKKKFRNIFIISDSYIPQKISSAGMIYNLSKSLAENEINVTCVFAGKIDKNIIKNYNLEAIHFINTDLFTSLRNKSLILRFIFEILTAFILAIKCFFHRKKKLDLIIWYGPSVFLWIVVKTLNLFQKVPVYYILRDIFPDWLVAVKIIRNPLLIWFLNLVSNYQYSVSDIIGVETFENIQYLKKTKKKIKKVEMLANWPNIVTPENNATSPLLKNFFYNITHYAKKNKYLTCVYIGNLSVAHDYNSLIEFFDTKHIIPKLQINIFSKPSKLKAITNKSIEQKQWGLVENYNLPFIFSKIDCGIVTLNRFAKTSNIPGKFVSYTQHKLPIICFAKIGSPLAKLIYKYDCGVVIDLTLNHKENREKLYKFIEKVKKDNLYFSRNSYKLFSENFNTNKICSQILNAFD